MKMITLAFMLTVINLAAIAQQLDRIESHTFDLSVWRIAGLDSNYYDGNGRLIKNIHKYYYPPDSSWRNSTQTLRSYNSFDSVSQIIGQSWNNGTLQTSYTATYQYDAQGRRQTILTIGSSSTSKTRDTFIYDASGYLTNTISYSWNQAQQKFQNSGKVTLTNDSTGRLLLLLNQNWTNSPMQWNDFKKRTYTYTSANNVSAIVYEDMVKNAWVISKKDSNTYDVSDFTVQWITQNYDTAAKTFKNYARYLYTSNLNGSLSTRREESWKDGVGPWFAHDSFYYYYLPDTMAITNFVVTGMVNPPVINDKNATVKITVSAATDVTALQPVITITSSSRIDPPSGSVQNFSVPVKYTVTARDSSKKEWTVIVNKLTGVGMIAAESGPFLFPVPCNDVFYLDPKDQNESAVIKLMNLQGSVLLEHKVSTGINNIQVNELPAGIYLVVFESPLRKHFQKLIIER